MSSPRGAEIRRAQVRLGEQIDLNPGERIVAVTPHYEPEGILLDVFIAWEFWT